MSLESPKTDTKQKLLSASTVDELRAQRVWRLSSVAWFTWVFFSFYFWWRKQIVGELICIAEVIFIQAVFERYRRLFLYRRVMNWTLGACAVGITLVSLSDPSLRYTMFFFPVSILIASQIIGVREAFYWLLVNFAAHTVYFLVTLGPAGFFSIRQMDEVVLVYGVATCTFFCCQQGEAFYRERTTGLVLLSQKLRRKSRKLHRLATTDSLTGLTNRYQLLQLLREYTTNLNESGSECALLLLDMDGFKEINDTLGHPTGDKALKEVARRIKECAPENSIVARLGGDEFCVVVKDIPGQPAIESLAANICKSLKRKYSFEEMEFPLSASLGIAYSPLHTKCSTELLAYADTAMFCAKTQRSGYEVYDPQMTRQLIEYRGMQDRLSVALERNEFFLLYQPQVDLRSGEIIAVEALLRWRNDGEVIPPVIFIPLLEKSREIINVGKWIIEEACRQLQAWNEKGIDLGISINLSSIQFADASFEQNVVEPLATLGAKAARIDFEITESLLVEDVKMASERLNRLKKFGATISIDDFGTGYSSLAYLRQLPLDRLKIDRAFIKDIPEADDGIIAKSIVVLSKALGLEVLAEGVETTTQLEFLKSIDCDQYQGYFMSPPVLAERIEMLYQESNVEAHVADTFHSLATS